MDASQDPGVTDSEEAANLHEQRDVTDVTATNGRKGRGEVKRASEQLSDEQLEALGTAPLGDLLSRFGQQA